MALASNNAFKVLIKESFTPIRVEIWQEVPFGSKLAETRTLTTSEQYLELRVPKAHSLVIKEI